MHLIFIRHGDPDYSIDSVTEKGQKELELLSKRFANFKATELFVSPMGRAQKTAEAVNSSLKLEMNTKDWLREFSYQCVDPKTKKNRICWDNLPHDFYDEKKYFSMKNWTQTKLMKSGNIQKHYEYVCRGIDEILESYDYSRFSSETPIYGCFPHHTKEEAAVDTHLLASQKDLDEKNLVFVCHLGVMFAIIAHLTGVSPVQLWQSFFVAPSSVTIVGAQERNPGEVVWRVQTMGDCSHLVSGGETVSASGYFGNCLSI